MFLAAISVTLSACRWRIAIGVAVGLALFGILAIAAGVRSRRRGAVIVGALFILGAAVSIAIQSSTIVAWVGAHELDVHVIVVDASTLTPIANARVEPLNGPYSPMEGSPPAVDSEFDVIPLENSKTLTTNNRGYTQFSHRFNAAGNDGLFTKSGYVDTRQVWLRVTCPGYVTTYLPIDQQSARPRDIKNSTPIWVTVPIAKD
ncbi:MAG: hypothetical protein R3C01_15630 [Planctomycetaceae bacterium]